MSSSDHEKSIDKDNNSDSWEGEELSDDSSNTENDLKLDEKIDTLDKIDQQLNLIAENIKF